MTTDDNRERDAYLWDPAANPAADVEAVERRIASARFNAALRPLILPGTSRRPNVYRSPLLAMAATLALVTIGVTGLWSWRSRWPVGTAWPVTIERGSSPTESATALRLNQPL